MAATGVGESDEFARFSKWTSEYLKAGEAEQADMIGEGARLAEGRRQALVGLMKSNPSEAARNLVAEEIRTALPAEIVGRMEAPFHGIGIPRMLVFDHFERGESRHALSMELDGHHLHLHPALRRGTLVLNREAKVKGYRLGAHFLLLEARASRDA